MGTRTILALAVVLGLAGCGGGGGGGLSQDLASTRADYQIIDLESGAVEAVTAIPDLATAARFRDRYLVVRRLPARSAALGQAASTYAAQGDEAPASVALPPCYLAVFELTRAQWRRIAGDQPWTTVQPAALAGSGGDELPACGISHERAVAALAAFRLGGLDLRLPDDAVWESAARSGAAVFPWGDARDGTAIQAAAVVAESSSVPGPLAVGTRQAAPSGCYDLVGNVAEWSAEGNLRGGSWSDPLCLARPANVRDLPTDIPLATAGVRVVFRPASR